jgi:hypothetical protein
VAIVLVDDRPGSLHKLLSVLARNKINIDDCYGIAIECDRTAAVVLDIERQPEAVAVLDKAGFRLLDDLADR